MTSDTLNYSISIRTVDIDNETMFEARVKELPNVVEYADSHEEAYELACDSIETTRVYFEKAGRQMPPVAAPIDDVSGRITLRMGKGLHRAVAEAATLENTSLNQFLVSVIAFHTGFGFCARRNPVDNWVSLGESTSARQRKPDRPKHLKLIHSNEPEDGLRASL